MSAATASLAIPHDRRPLPAALFELLAFSIAITAASLAFVTGWLSINAAVVLTVVLLATLIVLSWIHLGQGRHPVFLFLCTLALFQGGRLIAFCLGEESNPLDVVLMAQSFVLSRQQQGLTLLCVVVSAVCVYLTCRLRYVSVPPPDTLPATRFLPFLYLVYYFSLPVQFLKNYLYLKYVLANGGYLVFFTDYAGLTASVPLAVRIVALITYPVFIAIFVIERRRRYLWLVTTLYFASAALFLFTGSRMDLFSLILTLWYVARVKRPRRSRLLLVLGAALVLVVLSNAIQAIRFDESENLLQTAPRLVKFVNEQGISLNITEVAIRYRSTFEPFALQYLQRDALSKFISSDVTNYHRGQQLSLDVPHFLNPGLFYQGLGTGGTYLAEGFILGGLAGVIVISVLIGLGFSWLQRRSCNALAFFFGATILPDLVMLPRGGIMVWLSTALRTLAVAAMLVLPWLLIRTLSSLGRSSPITPPDPVTL